LSSEPIALREGVIPHRGWMGIAALACVGVQLPGSLLLSTVALAIWLGLLAAIDQASLRRLWMPRFWGVTVIFAVGSGLLLGPRRAHGVWSVISPEGLRAGLLMVVRGAFIFGLAAWASRALGGRDLERAFARVGLARLGSALKTALRLLPELKDRLLAATPPARRWQMMRRLPHVAVDVICETARLAEEMSTSRRPMIAAVVGAPGSGKTTLVGTVLSGLRARGLVVGGVTQPAIVEEGARVGYLLRDASTGEERPFARRRTRPAREQPGFSFDDEGWSWAERRVQQASGAADVLVVDELGRLEARGEGHLPALLQRRAEEARARVALVAVRADCADAIRERLGAFDLELPSGADAAIVERFIDQIAGACLEEQRGESPT
jgi:nucleoside-triphosphatase THEP1